MRRSVKNVECFAERYKATWRKYNQKFIIQTNSEYDAKPCSQGNVFGTYHDEMNKIPSISRYVIDFPLYMIQTFQRVGLF